MAFTPTINTEIVGVEIEPEFSKKKSMNLKKLNQLASLQSTTPITPKNTIDVFSEGSEQQVSQ